MNLAAAVLSGTLATGAALGSTHASSTGHYTAQHLKLGRAGFARYDAIPGRNLTDLYAAPSYPDAPDSGGTLSQFEYRGDGDNFGVHVWAWLVPEVSGQYTFWIASDDEGELRLGSSAASDADHVGVIARVPTHTNFRAFDWYPEQKSRVHTRPDGTTIPLINLIAGQPYYIEAVMKQGWSGTNLSVAWEGPGFGRQIIPGRVLGLPYPEDQPWPHPAFMTADTNLAIYENIPGKTLGDLFAEPRFPHAPDQNLAIDSLEYVADGFNLGLFGWTWIVPDTSGDHTFWLSSDDEGMLLLTDGPEPHRALEIASVPTHTNYRRFGWFPEQKSEPIHLEAGQPYYLGTLVKQGWGSAHFSVQWQGPEGPPELIPGAQLTTDPGPSAWGAGGPSLDALETGQLAVARYQNIPGTSLNALRIHPRFPGNPDELTTNDAFVAPPVGTHSGSFAWGWLIPEVSGYYRFLLASDDQGELYFSPTADPRGAKRIARVETHTKPSQFDKFTTQRSNQMRLEAGKAYYIAALAKQGWGGAALEVAWEGPIAREVIPGRVLALPVPFGTPTPGDQVETPPVIRSFDLHHNATQTAINDAVEVFFSWIGPDPVAYRIRNEEDGEDTPFLDLKSGQVTHYLTPGNGPKTLTLELMGADGDISEPESLSLTLEYQYSEPLNMVNLDGRWPIATSRAVVADLVTTGGLVPPEYQTYPHFYRLSADPTFPGRLWQQIPQGTTNYFYHVLIPFELSPGSGLKTIYGQVLGSWDIDTYPSSASWVVPGVIWLAEEGDSSAQLLLFEDFALEELPAWIPFGNPGATINYNYGLETFQGGSLEPGRDASSDSGAYTEETFEISPGLVIEARLGITTRVFGTAPDCNAHLEIALADPLTVEGAPEDRWSLFEMLYIAKDCPEVAPEERDRFWLRTANNATEAVIPLGPSTTAFVAQGPLQVHIVVRDDYRIELHFRGEHLGTSEEAIPARFRTARILAAGQSTEDTNVLLYELNVFQTGLWNPDLQDVPVLQSISSVITPVQPETYVTTSRAIKTRFRLRGDPGGVEYQISESFNYEDAVWLPFPADAIVDFTLSETPEWKTVYARVRVADDLVSNTRRYTLLYDPLWPLPSN